MDRPKTKSDYKKLLSESEGREVSDLEVEEFLLGNEEFLDQIQDEAEQENWEHA